MITEAEFSELSASVAQLNGISEDDAAGFVALVGDTIEQAEDGRVIVRAEGGAEVARLLWPAPEA